MKGSWGPWIAVGIALGLGSYTFWYANGPSYFSDDPKACINCHVMNPNFHSWEAGPHAKSATCNDCHVPHAFLGHWLAKAKNGWNHSVKFTLQNYEKPIRIKEANRKHLLDNCILCHGQQIDRMPEHPVKSNEGVSCLDCHVGIGHAL